MTSFIAAGGSGRSTSVIPAVPAASSVTTIAFIRHPLYPVLAATPSVDYIVHYGIGTYRGTRPDGEVPPRPSSALPRQTTDGRGGSPIDAHGQSFQDVIVRLLDAGLWATTSSPRRTQEEAPQVLKPRNPESNVRGSGP